MSKVKSGMGDASEHKTNKQFGKGPGVTNHPLKKSTVNPTPPVLKEGTERAKNVPMAPKINEGATGKTGGRRIINSEGSPAGRNAASAKSTFRAPRSESGGSVTDIGYTKLGKV